LLLVVDQRNECYIRKSVIWMKSLQPSTSSEVSVLTVPKWLLLAVDRVLFERVL